MDEIARTLASPDGVRRDVRFPDTRQFSRWFEDVHGGKFVVVVVVSDRDPWRHGIVTAYLARGLAGGVFEWQRS